jgi:hypothetical protein
MSRTPRQSVFFACYSFCSESIYAVLTALGAGFPAAMAGGAEGATLAGFRLVAMREWRDTAYLDDAPLGADGVPA